MSEQACQEIRERLHAFRAGEGTPLWRVKVEAHLEHCASCRGEVWFQAQLQNAAQPGPEPLSDDRKRAVLEAVHRQIDPHAPGKVPEPGPRWGRFLIPAAVPALAAAAVAMFIWLRPAPMPEQSGWLATELGVEAFAPDQTPVQFFTEPGDEARPVLQLEAQAVMVRFTRPEDVRPLEVRTPHATVVVRGTVFFVEVRDGRTVVGVQRGRVEVVGGNGETVLVGAQQQGESGAEYTGRVSVDSPHFVMLDELFPVEVEPLPDLPEPPPKKIVRRKPREPEPEPPDPKIISRVVGRHMWLVQECYEYQLKKDSSLAGSIEVEVVYSGDGSVAEASVTRDTMGSQPVSDCILQKVSRFKFPTSDAGPVTVRIPFVFTLAPNRQGK